jgi:ribosomal protein L32
MISDRNCRNCGAPVKPGEVCEYCGTLRPVPVQSAIKMTADSITITCDTLRVEELDYIQDRHGKACRWNYVRA